MKRDIVTTQDRKEFLPVLKDFIFILENTSYIQLCSVKLEATSIDLSDTMLNPYKLVHLLEELGYEKVNQDDEGKDVKYWIDMKRKDDQKFDSGCEELCISGCAMTFELKLSLKDF